MKQKSKKYDFEYGFDVNNRLICVNQYFDYGGISSQEFLVYKKSDQLVLGLIYTTNGELEGIIECEYKEDKIIRYEYVQCSYWDEWGEYTEIISEEYIYYEGKIVSAKVDCMLSIQKGTREEYSFCYENEEMSFFTLVEYHETKRTNYGDDIIFDVKKKKVYDIKE